MKLKKYILNICPNCKTKQIEEQKYIVHCFKCNKKEFGIEMKRFIIYIFLILLIIPLTNADIVSVNSQGSGENVVLGNKLVEGFFFGNPTQKGQIGGASGEPLADIILCNETFNYIKLYGKNMFHVDDFISDMNKRTNNLYPKSKTEIYITNWQSICSDRLKKTLKEDLVCSKIRYSNDTKSILKILGPDLSISENLLNFYIKNKKNLCPVKPLSIISLENLKRKPTFLIFLLFGFVIAILLVNKNKKKITYIMKTKYLPFLKRF